MEAAVALNPAPARTGSAQTDAWLVAAVRRGDDRAFEELYARYQRRICAYVFGMLKDHARAEDLAQDVFVSALRRMRDTDRPIAFKPWIYEIAKNACIDQFRRQRRGTEVSYDADGGLGSDELGRLATRDAAPDAVLEGKQDLDHLRGALGGLSESHHQILVMREFEGLSYREIGERMGLSRPSVESTLFRARKRLTEEYEELVTGARCERIQHVLAASGDGRIGVRDRRSMTRHLSYCQPCRRAAYAAGCERLLPGRASVGAKIAALLPLPAFLRRRLLGGRGDAGASRRLPVGGHAVASWAASVEPVAAGWTKAVATAATVAAAGVGVGAATRSSVPASAAHSLDAPALLRGGDGPRHSPLGTAPAAVAASAPSDMGEVPRAPSGAARPIGQYRSARAVTGGAAAPAPAAKPSFVTSAPAARPRQALGGRAGSGVGSIPDAPRRFARVGSEAGAPDATPHAPLALPSLAGGAAAASQSPAPALPAGKDQVTGTVGAGTAGVGNAVDLASGAALPGAPAGP